MEVCPDFLTVETLLLLGLLFWNSKLFSCENTTPLGKINSYGSNCFPLAISEPLRTIHQEERGQIQSYPFLSTLSYLAGTWGGQEGPPGLDPRGALGSEYQTAPC